MKPIMIDSCDCVGHLSGGSVAIHVAAEEALVLGAASEHFPPQVSRFERSGLNALNISLKSGFERCRR